RHGLHPTTIQELAHLVFGVLVRHVDHLAVDRQRRGTEAGYGRERLGIRAVADLEHEQLSLERCAHHSPSFVSAAGLAAAFSSRFSRTPFSLSSAFRRSAGTSEMS